MQSTERQRAVERHADGRETLVAAEPVPIVDRAQESATPDWRAGSCQSRYASPREAGSSLPLPWGSALV